MSVNKANPILPPQANPFQRFTIRLVDGKFVRVPKPELPSTQGTDQSGTSNQTEMRELFRAVHNQLAPLPKLYTPERPAAERRLYPDPTFDLPE